MIRTRRQARRAAVSRSGARRQARRNRWWLLPLTALLLGGPSVRVALGEDTFMLAILPDVQQETAAADIRLRDRLQWLVDNQDKNDGSARTITGVQWVQLATGALPTPETKP